MFYFDFDIQIQIRIRFSQSNLQNKFLLHESLTLIIYYEFTQIIRTEITQDRKIVRFNLELIFLFM